MEWKLALAGLLVGSLVGLIAMSYSLLMTDWFPRVFGIGPDVPFQWVLALALGIGIGAAFGALHKLARRAGIQLEMWMTALPEEQHEMQQRLAAGNFRINGVDLSPPQKTIAIGKQIITLRADTTIQAIHKALEH